MISKRWLPFVVFFLFVAGMVVSADTGHLQWLLDWVGTIPLGDKVGHLFLLSTLSFLLNAALCWRVAGLGRLRFQLGGLIIFLLITAEEISQIWIPKRSFDLGDLAANYMGIVCAELLSRMIRARSLLKDPAATQLGISTDSKVSVGNNA